MGKKKRQFIDKKSAVTFYVVHRSQQDPLVVDESAPGKVLVEAGRSQGKGRDLPENVKKRKEEERKYGVYFDDDYDYLQHLKSVDEFQADLEPVERFRVEPKATKLGAPGPKRNLNLPSSVFESEVKEKVGVLNKAAPVYGPRLDLDPDVVAALDDDFDFDDPDNVLEDDFIAMATAEGDGEEEDEDESEEGSEDEEMEEEEEAGSRVFTNYSMTSSVIRRNAGLKLIDAQFERVMEEEYGDDEIGALDGDEIEGRVDPNSKMLLQLADEFKRSTALHKYPETLLVGAKPDSDDDDDGEEMVEIVMKSGDNLDCQSVLSLRTNQSRNMPKVIREPRPIKINRKTGIPEGVLGSTLTAENLELHQSHVAGNHRHENEDDAVSLVSKISSLSVRPKTETPEERRARKGMVRELRRERRAEKKANTVAFKKEKLVQVQSAINAHLNCSGKKLV